MADARGYDRQLLLHGAMRNEILTLEEVRQYGRDSWGDDEYVSIFGLKPAQWHAKGIRLMGRTAVECTRDDLADAIGKDVAALVGERRFGQCFVLDPFAGSGNTLYWLCLLLGNARGLGIEQDAGVHALTDSNLQKLSLPISILRADFSSALSAVQIGTTDLIVAFIAPPWGLALRPDTGLDLRGTQPPVAQIVDQLSEAFPAQNLLCVVQIHERLDAAGVAELRERFDWMQTKIYSLNAPGDNHGILVGGRGWAANADL